MLKSMTGYGISKGNEDGYSITVEIRTLNSKFMDANLRIPKVVQDKELEIRNILTSGLVRGKVNLGIELRNENVVEGTVEVNRALFNAYYKEFDQLATEVQSSKEDLFRLALHSPDVLNTDKTEGDNQSEWNLVKEHLSKAIEHCNEFRSAEGDTLSKELLQYIDSIASFLDEIKGLDGERTKVIKERIREHVLEVIQNDDFDKNRFEQEMIYYIEKLDISEEIVRLGSHLDYFREIMQSNGAQGKKLGFISQEIGREINTIGSKANYAPVQRHVVCMKDELEKIKEQLLNVL